LDPENAARKHKPSPMITGCLFRSSNSTLHDCAAGSPFGDALDRLLILIRLAYALSFDGPSSSGFRILERVRERVGGFVFVPGIPGAHDPARS
jgi:hypothetical protein